MDHKLSAEKTESWSSKIIIIIMMIILIIILRVVLFPAIIKNGYIGCRATEFKEFNPNQNFFQLPMD